MSDNVVVLEQKSFLSDSINLKQLHRLLKTHGEAAIGILVAALQDKDVRVRMQAASKLLDMQILVAKEINADQMARLIAEIKIANGPKRLGATEEDENLTPIVDFTNVRAIE